MKKGLPLLTLFALFFIFPASVNASLIVIDQKGEVVWNVLASETSLGIPKSSEITVKTLPQGTPGANSLVSLLREGDRFTLNVKDGSQEKSLDVSQVGGEIIEIEERPQARRVKIGILGEKFLIEEEGTLALTDYPIKIDPTRAELSVVTDTGHRILPFLPKEAFEVAVRSRVISKQKDGETMQLIEGGQGELAYDISGEKTINLLNLFKLNVPVRTSISALTGEVLLVEQPTWLRVFGFLFS
nr:hypothetical protein [uncultured bacterium]